MLVFRGYTETIYMKSSLNTLFQTRLELVSPEGITTKKAGVDEGISIMLSQAPSRVMFPKRSIMNQKKKLCSFLGYIPIFNSPFLRVITYNSIQETSREPILYVYLRSAKII